MSWRGTLIHWENLTIAPNGDNLLRVVINSTAAFKINIQMFIKQQAEATGVQNLQLRGRANWKESYSMWFAVALQRHDVVSLKSVQSSHREQRFMWVIRPDNFMTTKQTDLGDLFFPALPNAHAAHYRAMTRILEAMRHRQLDDILYPQSWIPLNIYLSTLTNCCRPFGPRHPIINRWGRLGASEEGSHSL